MQNRKIALYGVLVALAMIFSYIETMLPSIGIPGVKLGLANLSVIAALYLMSLKDAFFISLIRILLTAVTFGNVFSMWYSLAGGMLSLVVMYLIKKKGWLDSMGVSIAGGITHNLGQLLVAGIVLESAAVASYLPVLILSGTITGALIGMLGGMIIRRLPRI
ncbi:MAG: Gx transporter family protein [Eubacteriales bacterium]|nr:Gx transporter family protein [Eubacteriales bacterium]